MKNKLLVLLIASIPMLMPNLASAIKVDINPGDLNLPGCTTCPGWYGCC